MSFAENIQQIGGDVAILLIEKRSGLTCHTGPTGSTNPMNVLIDVCRQIEIDNVLDIARRNRRSSGMP